MRAARTLRASSLLAVLLVPAPAGAGFVAYTASDPNAVPGTVSTVLSGEQLTFFAAASQFGRVQTTNLSGTSGNNGPYTLAPGATLTLAGNDTNPNAPASIAFGVTTFAPTTLNGFSASAPNAPFVRLVPDALTSGVNSTSADFKFSSPIQAFGVFITGLGTAAGNLQVLVYDHGPGNPPTPHSILGIPATTPGAPYGPGGGQYFGFTEPGAGIQQVAFQLTGFSSKSRDIIGLDGVTFVTPVPEPSTFLLFAAGGLVLLVSRARSRSAAR